MQNLKLNTVKKKLDFVPPQTNIKMCRHFTQQLFCGENETRKVFRPKSTFGYITPDLGLHCEKK